MRTLWLVFAQAATATLAVIFVVSLVKAEWMAWRRPVVEVRESMAPATAPVARVGRPAPSVLSFSGAAGREIP